MPGRAIVAVVAAASVATLALTPQPQDDPEPPTTGFEDRNGESWTTHDEELDFLDRVGALSERMSYEQIGTTAQGRPLHLVRLGAPTPVDAEDGRDRITTLFACTQHGNEPAGREACLKLLRDLAFTDDPDLVHQLETQTILLVPTANPDGRAADSRGNSRGTDINRDHLNLETEEARAMAAVVRDWAPDMVLDLHEYGPSIPPVYDDDVLYLWPRNLNVDHEVHDVAKDYALTELEPCLDQGGYTADEYGLFAAGDVDLYHWAGGADEGIARNAMGLRHSLGILIESAVTARVVGTELIDEAETNRRRVASHMRVTDCTLEYLRAHGHTVAAATDGAPLRKTAEGHDGSAPVYFDGQDEDTTVTGTGGPPPDEASKADPPPCGYALTLDDAARLATALSLHGIDTMPQTEHVFVSLAQPAEPVIPLLLDARASRSSADATPVAC